MRIACIIMAHKEPGQVERLIKKFSPLPFDFYIHIDEKINARPFEYLAGLPNVHFIQQRIRVRWASYSFLNAVIQSLKEVSVSGIPYDFLTVMSGQDYPIKPVSQFYDSLAENKGRNFISYELGNEWWSHAISRVNQYHFTNFDFRGRYRIQFFLNALLPSRKFPLPYKLFGGPRAMCMTITLDCASYIVDFIQKDKKLRRFIRFTWGPDEFVIPTLIMNSEFKETVINDNFYYIDWSGGGSNPKILRGEDYDKLVSTDKLMARKFDIRVDSSILDRIDKVVDR
jgi:hypothetical protein